MPVPGLVLDLKFGREFGAGAAAAASGSCRGGRWTSATSSSFTEIDEALEDLL